MSALVATTLVAMTLATSAAASPASIRARSAEVLERNVLREVNEVRAAYGLKPLAPNAGLEAAAVGHSRAMLTNGFFSHRTSSGESMSERVRHTYPSKGFRVWSVGENLLFDSGLPSSRTAISAWMASPAHRRNILSPSWREIGIGVAWVGTAPARFGGGQACVITVDFGVRARAARPA